MRSLVISGAWILDIKTAAMMQWEVHVLLNV